MRKHITIEKITIAAFILTLLLLMLAALIFYRNSLHLKKIQQKENTEKASLLNKAINLISSNAIIIDTREVFRPEVLKTDPLSGLQLSIAEYMVAIYILNLNNEKKGIEKPISTKRKINYRKKENENYQLAKTNYKELLIAFIFLTIISIDIVFFYFISKKHRKALKNPFSNNIKLKLALNTFSKYSYSKKVKSSFIYSYYKEDYKPLWLFKNKTGNYENCKNGIKINLNPDRTVMKKPGKKTKIK